MPVMKEAPSEVYIEDLATATSSWHDARTVCSKCESARATHAMMVCLPDPQPVVDVFTQWIKKLRRNEVISEGSAQAQLAIFRSPMSLFQWEKTIFLCNSCHQALVLKLNRLDSYRY